MHKRRTDNNHCENNRFEIRLKEDQPAKTAEQITDEDYKITETNGEKKRRMLKAESAKESEREEMKDETHELEDNNQEEQDDEQDETE